ncbi:unnamed protein product [Adineta steineri]|uniref:Fas-binding factor 1 C-terminal domain-containing protein n=1 Tax=Adineta steineri TaxID=433720 RepID=A0A818I3L4_9BILA|nr:unnamed protein product [Adineta steineri]CAF3519233.1 unnamed protein product [Adineta steineri]
MSRHILDDLLQDLNIDNDNKSSTHAKNQWSSANANDDDDWLLTPRDTKKSTTNTLTKRQDDDDFDADDKWNRTGDSNISYTPNFGGTITNTFTGQDTIQRIVSQPRPATSSGSRTFDDLFGNSPPKNTTLGDTDRNKKSVRFDEFDLARPSTAPSPADTLQNRSNTGALSSMRTGLDPKRSTDLFPPTKKTTNESNNPNDWLGLKDESSEEDDLPQRRKEKIEPAITTLAKKTPLAPVHEVSATVSELPKKSVLDDLIEEDRRALSEKTPITATATINKTSQDSWFSDHTNSNKRPSVGAIPKTSLHIDNQQVKPSTKPLFDTKTDSAFKDVSESLMFNTNSQVLPTTRNNSSTVNLDMKKLEFENNELRMTLDHMKRQHEIETTMLEDSHKHRLEYIEKTCERRESRLKEENEHLLRQLNDRTQQYENDKAALIMDHQRRLDDLQRDRTTELENLRTLQRQTLDHLRREHEQTIQRLKQLKQEEVSTALDVTTHTRAFESVVDHMEQNAKNIDQLRLKIEAKHSSAMTDKEIESRAKEQQLKAYEERLHHQSTDFERERKNLQELISRLEVHLSDQTKLVEEERWKALQAQKRMEAMQDALNGEQRLFTEKISRDRSEIQRSKDQLLDDQKLALASIYESRSQLAEERAKVEALQKSFQEQKHRDMLQNATIDADTRAQQKLVNEQLVRLEKREQELIKREEALILERRSLAELKQRIDNEQSSLKNDQDDIKQKQLDIEHANEMIKKEKERLSQLYFELHALDGKNTGRLQQLQKSISNLRQKEELMNEQYTRMSDDRQNRNQLRSSVTLKQPSSMIDSGFSTLQLASHTPILPINSTQQSVEESTILRALRMNALQDQLYIQDEMSFLNSLRTGNHLSTRNNNSNSSNLHRHSELNLLRTNH